MVKVCLKNRFKRFCFLGHPEHTFIMNLKFKKTLSEVRQYRFLERLFSSLALHFLKAGGTHKRHKRNVKIKALEIDILTFKYESSSKNTGSHITHNAT